jgi:hypothetical protein
MARSELSILKKIVNKKKIETNNAKLEKIEKRIAKEAEKPKIPNFCLEFSDSLQTKKKVYKLEKVQAWLREGIETRITWSVTLPKNQDWWKGKERSLARLLLKAYDEDAIKRAIFYLCDNWEDMIRHGGGKFYGIPTIGLLWDARDIIFTNAERGVPYWMSGKSVYRPDKYADEYKEPSSDAIGHGW